MKEDLVVVVDGGNDVDENDESVLAVTSDEGRAQVTHTRTHVFVFSPAVWCARTCAAIYFHAHDRFARVCVCVCMRSSSH